MRIAFVILNYNSHEETLGCIASIKKNIDIEEYMIVVVDNASPDGSGKQIRDHFNDDDHVKVIINQQNVGYARGNNMGLAYCRKQSFDFYCVMNPDTRIIQRDFGAQVKADYERFRFDVLGPKILDLEGEDCCNNPGEQELFDLQSAKKRRALLKRRVILYYFFNVQWMKGAVARVLKIEKKHSVNEYKQNCILAGCCLIFSDAFFSDADGFFEGTFLYEEEPILYTMVMQAGGKTLYSPHVEIRHANAGVHEKSKSFMRFRLKNMIRSLDAYIDHLENAK